MGQYKVGILQWLICRQTILLETEASTHSSCFSVTASILLKAERNKALQKGETYDPSKAFFHEEKPQAGAWMPSQVIDFLIERIDLGQFYIICPDNEVDRETDDIRMTWTMNDIVENRPPLSRWHPEYKEKYIKHVEEQKAKGNH